VKFERSGLHACSLLDLVPMKTDSDQIGQNI